MLKFEDERSIRCRANVRSLRKMVIRLTEQLTDSSQFFKPQATTVRALLRSTAATTNVATATATAAASVATGAAARLFVKTGSKRSNQSGGNADDNDDDHHDNEYDDADDDDDDDVIGEEYVRRKDELDRSASVSSVIDKNKNDLITMKSDTVPMIVDDELNLTAAYRQFLATSLASKQSTTTDTRESVAQSNIVADDRLFDQPLSVYVNITRAWLIQLCEKMLRFGYSLSYMRNTLSLIRHDAGRAFPLNGRELKAFNRSIVGSKQKFYGDRHKQTDEIYAMCDTAYERMRVYAINYLQTVRDKGVGLQIVGDLLISNSRFYVIKVLFCYLYLAMYHTGKRMSDICILSLDDLKNLLTNHDIAVRIPKTDRIGRISMSKIEDRENFVEFLSTFIDVCERYERLKGIVPFDQYRIRRQLNRIFKLVYESVMKTKKPNGLSFHALRRRKAARFFKSGQDLETIRECLDHADSRMTNVYINKFLLANNNNL